MCGVTTMPSHLLRCQPFAADSAFNLTREDDETALHFDLNDNTNDDASDDDEEIEASETAASEAQRKANDGEDLENDTDNTTVTADCFNRCHTFIIPTVADAGVNAYFAKRTCTVKGRGQKGDKRKEKITAIAVRERGTDEFSQKIRILFATPLSTTQLLESWIAVPRSNEQERVLLSATVTASE